MKVIIYTLAHPITGEIRYIGKTKNPIERYKNHLNKRHNETSYKRNWIESIKNIGLKPIMEILDEVPEEEWKFWERFWINQFISWNFNLVNHTSGGDGLTMGNQTSFRKGQKSWNQDKGNTFICENCNTIFKACISTKRRFCSQDCASVYKAKNLNSGTFKKGIEVWNKNRKGYKTSKRKPILQFSLDGKFIREWECCEDAAKEYSCIGENIRNCCLEKSKTAKGYKWKFKN